MHTLHFEKIINRPVTYVFDTMLEPYTYSIWTSGPIDGSHYKGNMTLGSELQFLDKNNDGLLAKVEKYDKDKFVKLKYLGEIKSGEVVKNYKLGGSESYTFTSVDNDTKTKLVIDLEGTEDMDAMFDGDGLTIVWNDILNELDKLCENNPPRRISISTIVNQPIEKVWKDWSDPKAIMVWNTAGDGWICPKAEVDLRVGGHFSSIMSSVDGKDKFDFNGDYTIVEEPNRLSYTSEGVRSVDISFKSVESGTSVEVIFDSESENTLNLQKQGWGAILENFKRYCEGK